MRLHSEYEVKDSDEIFKDVKNLYKLYVEKEKYKDNKLFELS